MYTQKNIWYLQHNVVTINEVDRQLFIFSNKAEHSGEKSSKSERHKAAHNHPNFYESHYIFLKKISISLNRDINPDNL